MSAPSFPSSRRFARILGTSNFISAVIAEFFATAVFLTIGIGCVITMKTRPDLNTFLTNNLCWGFGVMFSASLVMSISGGHLNPAVSIPLWAMGRLSAKRAFAYSIAQIAGAFVGTAVAYFNYTDAINAFDGGHRVAEGRNGTLCFIVTCPSDVERSGHGVLDQVIGTAILTLVVSLVMDARNKVPPFLHPTFCGLAVMMIGMCYGQNDGYPINPARDLGARLFGLFLYGGDAFSAYDHWWWVPVVGPMLGGFTGFLLYAIFLDIPQGAEEDEKEEPRRIKIADRVAPASLAGEHDGEEAVSPKRIRKRTIDDTP